MSLVRKYLEQFVTENRLNVFNHALENRTRYFTVALEDLFQSHNASAVLRSCDCFGIQDVHIIENKNEYTINPDVSLGSSKWLSLYRYNQAANNTAKAIALLKDQGYRIVATVPRESGVPLEEFDIEKGKAAFLFGTELHGLSGEAIKLSDESLYIPMHGFTESFNISVSAAIILHYLSYKLRSSEINWKLDEEEKEDLFLDWLRKSIKRSELLERQFWNNID